VSFGVRLCPVPPKFHQNLEPVSLFHNGNLNTSYKNIGVSRRYGTWRTT